MARLIVMGNEKGGSGKSTTAMHLITALVRAGHAVGALDLDLRQKSLFRYLDNRAGLHAPPRHHLPMPRRIVLEPSALDSRAEAEAEEQDRFEAALAELAALRLHRRRLPGLLQHLFAPGPFDRRHADHPDERQPGRFRHAGPARPVERPDQGAVGLFRDGLEGAAGALRHRPAADGLGGAAQPHDDARRPQQAPRRRGAGGARPPHRLPPGAGLLRARGLPRAVPVRA